MVPRRISMFLDARQIPPDCAAQVLLRRLGHPDQHVVHRCAVHRWRSPGRATAELSGAPPSTSDRQVADLFGRTTTRMGISTVALLARRTRLLVRCGYAPPARVLAVSQTVAGE